MIKVNQVKGMASDTQCVTPADPAVSVRDRLRLTEPSTRRGLQRCEALLHHAEQLFLQHGVNAVSLDDVVQQVGGSKATIYQYFGSKQGLLAAVVLHRCQRFFERMNFSPVLPPDQPLKTVLLERCHRLYQAFNEPDNVAFLRLVISESQRDPELAQLAYESGIGRGLAEVAGLLTQSAQRGEISCPYPRESAVMLVGLLRHAQWRLLIGLTPLEADFDPERFFDYQIDRFIRGHQ